MKKWYVFDSNNFCVDEFDTKQEAITRARTLHNWGFDDIEIRHMTASDSLMYLVTGIHPSDTESGQQLVA